MFMCITEVASARGTTAIKITRPKATDKTTDTGMYSHMNYIVDRNIHI